jgi:hypothetical protein
MTIAASGGTISGEMDMDSQVTFDFHAWRHGETLCSEDEVTGGHQTRKEVDEKNTPSGAGGRPRRVRRCRRSQGISRPGAVERLEWRTVDT